MYKDNLGFMLTGSSISFTSIHTYPFDFTHTCILAVSFGSRHFTQEGGEVPSTNTPFILSRNEKRNHHYQMLFDVCV